MVRSRHWSASRSNDEIDEVDEVDDEDELRMLLHRPFVNGFTAVSSSSLMSPFSGCCRLERCERCGN